MPTRRAKIEALLKEHLPPAPLRRAAAAQHAPTHFEARFYQDLVAYNVPMEPTLRDRGYVVGRVYMMYGGAVLTHGSLACNKLAQIIERVGLTFKDDSEVCKPPQGQSGEQNTVTG